MLKEQLSGEFRGSMEFFRESVYNDGMQGRMKYMLVSDEERKGTHECVFPRLSKKDANIQVGRRWGCIQVL